MSVFAIATALVLAQQDPVTQTQSTQPDPSVARMEQALKATGLNYSKVEGGLSFLVDYTYPENRVRRVLVTMKSSKTMGRETHNAYTQVWTGSEAPSANLVREVSSKAKKLGFFYVYKDSQGMYGIRFGVNIESTLFKPGMTLSDMPILRLKDTLGFVAQVGEETSKELGGKK